MAQARGAFSAPPCYHVAEKGGFLLGIAILVASLLLQVTAALLALRLIPITGRRTGWILIAAAILLMGVRRGITLAGSISDPSVQPIDVGAEVVALAISLLMVGGLAWVGPFFRSLAQARASLQVRERQQAAIADLGKLALAGADVESLIQESVRSVARAMNVEFVKVLELKGTGSFLLRGGVGWEEGLVGHAIVPGGAASQAGYTIAAREPVIVDELSTDTRFTGRQLLEDHGVVSGVSVAIGTHDRPFGVLGVHSRRRRSFSDDDIHFLEASANVLADAIERAAEGERLRRLIDSAPDAMAIVDREARIVLANPRAEELFGYTRNEAVGKSVEFVTVGWQAVREDGTPLRREDSAVNVTLRTGEARSTKAAVTRPDGSQLWLQVRTSPLTEPGGSELHAAVVTIADVTDQHHLEGRIRQGQKLEAVGRLAGGVAHDFNNLLTVIGGLSELALERPALDDRVRNDLSLIQRASREAAALTHQLLAFSRRQVLQPRVLDPNSVVAELETLLRRTLEEHIEIRTDLDPESGRIRADPGQLHHVLLNLALNARDSMPTGGRLTIETRSVELDAGYAGALVDVAPGPYVEVVVSDTGGGMDEPTLLQIFEPFFTTKAPGQGTGLGLATAYGVVKQSGGYIWADSELGKGTRFTIHLPRVEEEAAGEQEPAAVGDGGSETILLVEDEEMVRDFAVRVLEDRGYRVLAAEHPESALRIVEEHEGPIHLLVTDLIMPGRTGAELAEEFVRLVPEAGTLFVSGYSNDVVSRLGLQRAEFLGKPFTASELARSVREVLDSRGG